MSRCACSYYQSSWGRYNLLFMLAQVLFPALVITFGITHGCVLFAFSVPTFGFRD